MEETISIALWKLLNIAVEKTNNYIAKTEELLIKAKEVYVKSKISQLEYVEGQGLVGYNTSYEYFTKETWPINNQFQFMGNVLKKLPEYEHCKKEIHRKYNILEQAADNNLSHFLQAFLNKAIYKGKKELLDDYITTFIKDLENSSVNWKLKANLDGIWLKEPEVRLNNGMIVRKPEASDLENECSLSMLNTYMSNTTLQKRPTSAILEFSTYAISSSEVHKKLENILEILRIFRLGSVWAQCREFSPQSILRHGGVSGTRYSTTYRYGLFKEDTEVLNSLIARLEPTIDKDFGVMNKNEKLMHLTLKRYRDALLQPVTIEARITSAITCLESLFLEEDVELSHRLSQRVAALLRIYNLSPIAVYKNVKDAYAIRSKYIHGAEIKKERIQSANELCKIIVNYARISILNFIQLQEKFNKKNLINKLDDSILDEKVSSDFKNLLNTCVMITS